MFLDPSELGPYGEKLAVSFLARQGYEILEQNFKSYFGEIDIIARHNGVYCFVEVKTRQNDSRGDALESVTKSKQRKIWKTAQSYMQQNSLDEVDARFDVIGISLDKPENESIELITNAFEMD